MRLSNLLVAFYTKLCILSQKVHITLQNAFFIIHEVVLTSLYCLAKLNCDAHYKKRISLKTFIIWGRGVRSFICNNNSCFSITPLQIWPQHHPPTPLNLSLNVHPSKKSNTYKTQSKLIIELMRWSIFLKTQESCSVLDK